MTMSKVIMKIGDAASAAGLTVKTLRYYANIRLVTPQISEETGYRNYAETDVAKLKFVGTARRFNFSIEECRELLGLYENKNRPSREVKKITLNKLDDIDAKLAELQELKQELQTLANACDGDDRPNCPIIDGLAKS